MAISATSGDDMTFSRSKSAAYETTSGTLWTRRRLTEQAATGGQHDGFGSVAIFH